MGTSATIRQSAHKRQDQAAGDGVAIDRRDQRLRPGVERAEAVVQRIDQPPLAQPVEAGHRS